MDDRYEITVAMIRERAKDGPGPGPRQPWAALVAAIDADTEGELVEWRPAVPELELAGGFYLKRPDDAPSE